MITQQLITYWKYFFYGDTIKGRIDCGFVGIITYQQRDIDVYAYTHE